MFEQDHLLPKKEPKDWTMPDLENFGRMRLSRYFFMRDMLYSEVASHHKLRNIPDNPRLALKVGRKLCSCLLEPLHTTFGHVTIRSAFRSADVNECGSLNYRNLKKNEENYSRHVWDRLGTKYKEEGATACIVIPRFEDYLAERPKMSWRAMAWWIHDHLPYSEMKFFSKKKLTCAAFNLRWSEREVRSIEGPGIGPSEFKTGELSSPGKHMAEYPGFPKWERPTEHYPDRLG